MENLKHLLKNYKIELFILFIALLFSTWLMFATFSYDNGNMKIATKAWSDFANHIPLIRSFSFGNNFPPQFPLFSGPPIKYHFIFYAFAGLLEKLGLTIDYALNIPSILGFSFLILMIYLLSKEIFKSVGVGILGILFFLFHGSLDFINFFLKYPLSKDSLSQIINNSQFISFGPYDGNTISAFWNLNIYTNQRHLALSYSISLLIFFLFLRFKDDEKQRNFQKAVFIGLILGFSFLLNIAVFLMSVFVLISFLISFKNIRKYIFISLILAFIIFLPQYFFTQSFPSDFDITLHLGYLVSNLNILSLVNYWFQNLGLHLILIPIAFYFSAKNQRKILLSFFSLFILGNLLQFSPEIAANHKFFNYFMIIGYVFSAYILIIFWSKKNYLKPLVLILIFFLILSGIINFFPIYNDSKITIKDYPNNENISWIMQNTKPESVFLNNQYLYDNASLAGRKIFLGWPYFAWSQGYDTLSRDNLRKDLLNTKNLAYFCKAVDDYNLDYVDIETKLKEIPVNLDFFNKNFEKVFENTKDGYIIYKTKSGC